MRKTWVSWEGNLFLLATLTNLSWVPTLSHSPAQPCFPVPQKVAISKSCWYACANWGDETTSIHRYHGTQWATHNLHLKIALQLVFSSIYSLISSSLLQEGQWVKHQWKIIFQTRCLLSFITCMSKIQLCKYLIHQLCSNFKVFEKLQGTLHICSVIAALELVKKI